MATVLQEVQKALGVSDDRLEDIPRIVSVILQQAQRSTSVITLLFDLEAQRLLQVTSSALPKTAPAYLSAAKVAMQLAQHFNDMAAKVSKAAELPPPGDIPTPEV